MNSKVILYIQASLTKPLSREDYQAFVEQATKRQAAQMEAQERERLEAQKGERSQAKGPKGGDGAITSELGYGGSLLGII